MKKIILISGKARSGKDYIADLLKNKFEEDGKKVLKLAYADKLKEYLCILFNLDLATLNDLKNSEIPFCLNGLTMRQILQKFGTDIFTKNIDEMFWVKEAAKTIKNSDAEIILITDYRFNNERQIDSYVNSKVLEIRISGTNCIRSFNHISEFALDNNKFDYYYDNSDYTKTKENIENLYNFIKNN